MKVIIVALLLAAACVDSPAPLSRGLPETDACGVYPSRGDYKATFETRDGAQVVVLSREDFDGLVHERTLSKQWAYCVVGDQP